MKINNFNTFKTVICNNYAPNYQKYFDNPDSMKPTVPVSRYEFVFRIMDYLSTIVESDADIVNEFIGLFYSNRITMFYANAYFNSLEITTEALKVFIESAKKYFNELVENTVRQMLLFEFDFNGKKINIPQFNTKYNLFTKYALSYRNMYYRPIIDYRFFSDSNSPFTSMIDFSEDYIHKISQLTFSKNSYTENSNINAELSNPLSFLLADVPNKSRKYFSQIYTLSTINFSDLKTEKFAENNITTDYRDDIYYDLASELVITYNKNINNNVIESNNFNIEITSEGLTSNPNVADYSLNFNNVNNKNKFNFDIKYFAENYRVPSLSDIKILNIRSIIYKFLFRKYCYDPEGNPDNYDNITGNILSELQSDKAKIELYLKDLNILNNNFILALNVFEQDKENYTKEISL